MTVPSRNGATTKATAYGIDAPSLEYTYHALEHFLGKEKAQALWASTCLKAGAEEASDDPQYLRKLFKLLAAEPGAVGVLGRSLSIRLSSYLKFTQEKGDSKQ